MLIPGLNPKVVWLTLIASLAFNAGMGTTLGVRSYRQHCADSGRRGGPHRGAWMDKLNLTDEQSEQMKAARQELMETIGADRRQIREANKALSELMTADDPDRDAIGTQLDSIASARRQMQQHLVDHMLRIKAGLEPEQREAFNDVMLRRMFMFDGGRHGRGGPRGHRGERGERGWHGPDQSPERGPGG